MKLAATRSRNALQHVFSPPELNLVWGLERQRFKSSCFGVDRISGKQFDAERFWRIPSIRERRLNPTFSPNRLLAIAKPKNGGGYRIICIPTIEDRLIQLSVLYTIRDPLKKKGLLNTVSYGLVAQSGRTVQDARDRATSLRENGKWVYKADIQKFFDNIPRDQLENEIRRTVPQRSLHDLIISFSKVEIGDGFATDWQQIVSAAGIQAGVGVRQGMPLSPYFAGILLLGLDRLLEKRRQPVIRYVDDIIGFFKSRKECEDFDAFLRDQLSLLSLNLGILGDRKSKTMIFEPNQPAEFVGMEMKFGKDGRCSLFVSEKTLESVEMRFAELSKIDTLLQKKITLPFLGARLGAMKKGFIAAYHGAQNMTELKARVEAASTPVVEAVLEEVFGAAMKSLGRKERQFLGLE